MCSLCLGAFQSRELLRRDWIIQIFSTLWPPEAKQDWWECCSAPSWCQSWGGLGNAPRDPLWSSPAALRVPEPCGSAQGWWLALNHEKQQ